MKKKCWQICIGLEVHAQILTKSKLFSASSASISVQPNTHVSLIDAAYPGTLPVLNEKCVHQAMRTAFALNSTVQKRSIFERKHYYYCDLPQGYQITQQRAPIAVGGEITQVRINRIQLEQDSGKSNHDLKPNDTMVDLNRAGTALMEIVMEPDIRSAAQAGNVLRKLQHLLVHIGTCDGQMEDGSMRCDLNVSVRPMDQQDTFGERVEIKNMNSIRNLVRAAEYEAARQIECLESGQSIYPETRTFDAVSGTTKRMRRKESAKDYRFFPEPDLPPLCLEDSLIEQLKQTLPELPDAQVERLQQMYDLTQYESNVLVQDQGAVAYFEQIAKDPTRPNKVVANWVMNDLFGLLKATNTSIRSSPVGSKRLGQLIDLVVAKKISGKIAKEVLEKMYYEDERDANDIVQAMGLLQISDPAEIEALCRQVVADPVSRIFMRRLK